jgi:beta-1,2-mannobiose phosphorylase / 1,2-beta-oligomannan phosphorylase
MDPLGASPFRVERLGVVMRPDPAREDEVEGVLNPGAARGPDGNLYLFPRIVGKGNFSRIGIARVLFDEAGDIPVGVERIGYALEPEEPYELRPLEQTGGCEDPRVTFVEPLGLYVMSYVAWGPKGPRIALAISEDLLAWERLGLVDFQPDVEAHYGVIFNNFDNKDAAFFPQAIELHDGSKVLGMLHRPYYDEQHAPKGVADTLPSIWVSGCELEWAIRDVNYLRIMKKHAQLADPKASWEALRIGVGTPPVQTKLGYMTIYHGVSGQLAQNAGERNRVQYVAGALVFRRDGDRLMQYRSPEPIMIPEVGEETSGTVDNVVFPTGVDDRGNGAIDVYYGMADKYIGAARVYLPDELDWESREMIDLQRLHRMSADPGRSIV